MNERDKINLYIDFYNRLKLQPIYKKLGASERLYCITHFRTVFENATDKELKLHLTDDFLLNLIGQRGINRFKRLRELALSFEDRNRVEFTKDQIKKMIFNE